MSKSHIEVELQTKYNGEGFKKADQAVRTFSKQAKTATDSVSKITNALGTLDGKAGKIAGSIGNIFASFAHGGVIGLAIAGITAAFSLIGDKIKETQEKAKLAAERIKESFERSFDSIASTQAFNDLMRVLKYNAKRSDDKLATSYTNALDDVEIQKMRQEGIARREGMDDGQIAVDIAKENAAVNALIRNKEIRAAKDKLHNSHVDITQKQEQISDLKNDEQNMYKEYYGKYVADVMDQHIMDPKKSDYIAKILEGKKRFKDNEIIPEEYKQYVDARKKYEDQQNKFDQQIVTAEEELKILKKKEDVDFFNLKAAEEKNKTGEMQDQEAISKAYQKSYEEREKVEQEALAQAEKDLKDAQEAYQKAVEERDKVEQAAAEEAQKEREKLEIKEKTKQREKKHDEEVKRLDDDIEKAKKRLAEAEKKRADALDFLKNGNNNGGNVGGLLAKLDDDSRKKAKDEANIYKAGSHLDSKIRDMARRVFGLGTNAEDGDTVDEDGNLIDANGNIKARARKSASASDKASLRKYLDAKNLINGDAYDKEKRNLEMLQQRRDQLQEQMKDDIENIRKTIEGTLGI